MAQAKDEAMEIYKNDEMIRETINKLAGQLELKLNNSKSDIFAIAVNLLDICLTKGERK